VLWSLIFPGFSRGRMIARFQAAGKVAFWNDIIEGAEISDSERT